jgi:hypothetical protein
MTREVIHHRRFEAKNPAGQGMATFTSHASVATSLSHFSFLTSQFTTMTLSVPSRHA